MADIKYDSGDSSHDGGWEVNFDDNEPLTMDELEEILEDWLLDEELLFDIEGEQDFYA